MPTPKRWTPEEESELLQQIKDKMPNEEIAEAHGRSIGGVCIRKSIIAVRMSKEDDPKSIEEISEICDMTVDELKNQIEIDKKNRRNSKSSPPKKGQIIPQVVGLRKRTKQ